jgi:hypothetical protein
VCRFHVAAGEKLHVDKQFIWRPCPECHEASKHHLLKFGFLLLVRLTLVSQLREDLLMCSSYLPLGVPNELLLTSHQQVFWRRCRGLKKKNKLPRQLRASKTSTSFRALLPGRKKTSARGVSHAQSFIFFLFCFTLFLLASFYQKYKKI